MASNPAVRPLHVALIMDGNGRWAAERGLPRASGHQAGAAAVRRLEEASPSLGVGTLTLFAFSSDNWRRPASEVRNLMEVLRGFLDEGPARWVSSGVRVSAIGRRDRLPPRLLSALELAERSTGHGRGLHIRLAMDYSGRDAILSAVARLEPRDLGAGALSRETFARRLSGGEPVEVDLLIRTGGEQRLSDFMLWECAYAELHFSKVPWPDFTATHLAAAIEEFRGRARRFGGLGASGRGDQAARGGSAAERGS